MTGWRQSWVHRETSRGKEVIKSNNVNQVGERAVGRQQVGILAGQWYEGQSSELGQIFEKNFSSNRKRVQCRKSQNKLIGCIY